MVKIDFGDIYAFSDLEDFVNSKKFRELGVFNEAQIEVLLELVELVKFRLEEWHSRDDTESHKDIRNKLEKLEARFRNHRHETSRTFCGKAEY